MNDNSETTQSAPKEERVAMTVIVDKSLAVWLETQAAANKRARYREVEVILEEARAKEMPVPLATGTPMVRELAPATSPATVQEV